MIEVTFVLCDEWEGIYVGDTLVIEGSILDAQDGLEAVQSIGVFSIRVALIDETWFAARTNLPNKLLDVKFNKNVEFD